MQVIIPLEFFLDGGAQRGRTVGRRIAGIATQRGGIGGFDGVQRRREIRLAGRQRHNMHASGRQIAGFLGHGDGRRDGDVL